jgi:serine/threonine protein phosphatase 1
VDAIAIGDIHGRADLLAPLLDYVNRYHTDARLIFLGDIIDRGPASKDCLDMVQAELARNSMSELLLGNHEDMMLRFVDGGSDGSRSWCWNGGLCTVESYGYQGYDFLHEDGYVRLRTELAEFLKSDHSDHVDMIRNAGFYVELPEHVFVHAGIVPGLPMESQDPYQLRWNSKTLAAYHGPLPKTVVYGHMITATFFPERHVNRINIDCGAYESGVLCAAVFSGRSDLTFILSTEANGKREIREIDGGSKTRAVC